MKYTEDYQSSQLRSLTGLREPKPSSSSSSSNSLDIVCFEKNPDLLRTLLPNFPLRGSFLSYGFGFGLNTNLICHEFHSCHSLSSLFGLWSAMVCGNCQKKLGKIITPDPWKSGARNTTGKFAAFVCLVSSSLTFFLRHFL